VSEKYEPGVFSGLIPNRAAMAALLAVTVLAIAVILAIAQFSDDGAPADKADSVAAPSDGITLSGAAGDPAAGSAAVTGGTVQLALADLQPTRPGEHYALWLANDDDDLLALAAFRVGESGRVEISAPLPGELAAYRRIEISREPDDGDPDRVGAVILSAPTR
jgi:anti-sigma-K factor RskA